MGRSDQYVGLTDEAQQFLRDNEVGYEMCPHCGQIMAGTTSEVIEHFTGMFGNEYDLRKHYLYDGREADEFLQCSPWSSGPVFFIGLELSDGQEMIWTDDEIETYL